MRTHPNCLTCACTPEPVAPLSVLEKVLLGVAMLVALGSALVVLWVLYGVATMGTR